MYIVLYIYIYIYLSTYIHPDCTAIWANIFLSILPILYCCLHACSTFIQIVYILFTRGIYITHLQIFGHSLPLCSGQFWRSKKLWNHGLINYKDTKTNCRPYRLEIQSVMLVFDPALWTIDPPTFSVGHLPPLPKVKLLYIQKVCGWEVGGGVLSCFGDRLLQEFNTLYLTRFRTYTIALPPPNKSLGRE
jgi:hypothetical protein